MDVKVHALRLSYKMGICAIYLISILQISCPAYAATQSESTDIGLEENLPNREQTAQPRLHGYLGGEINYAEGIMNDAPYRGRLVYLFRVEYDEWVYVSNIGGLKAGVWLWQTPNRMQKLGVSVQNHPNQTAFDIMGRRQGSTDGVINIQWRMPENYNIHLDYNHDIGNVSKGDSVNLFLSRNIILHQALFNHDCMLVPGIDVEWESARLVDYYYGVRPEEATPNRPAYVGRETFNEKARLTGFYLINKSWTVFAGVQAAIFGPGITDSPIVTRHVTTRGYMGTAWLF